LACLQHFFLRVQQHNVFAKIALSIAHTYVIKKGTKPSVIA